MITHGARIRTHTRLGRPVYGTVTGGPFESREFFGRFVGYCWIEADDGEIYLRRLDDVTLHAPARPEWK